MKKFKLSIGILAFVGLAVLNFTKSETTFVQKAMANGTSVSSIWSSIVNYTTDLINSFTEKKYDCDVIECLFYPYSDPYNLDAPLFHPAIPGEIGCGVNGNTKTFFEQLLCPPLVCLPK